LAGIGLGQLQVLNERVKRRREIYCLYREALGAIEGVSFQEDYANGVGSRWLTVIALDPKVINIHPYVIMRYLRDLGIESRPCWKPMHLQPLCDKMTFVPHSPQDAVSSSLFLRCLCLPSGSNMSNADVHRVSSEITKIIQEA
jgi:pyridoxal phosphate-dependent aminotransferase EpsN